MLGMATPLTHTYTYPTRKTDEHIQSDKNVQCEWNTKGGENMEQNKIRMERL